MPLGDLIVSLWADQAQSVFRCTGIHVAPEYILTVAHAFKGQAPGARAFIGLLPGKHGAEPATLHARHERLDAALLRLGEPIPTAGLRLPTEIGARQGQSVRLHVIDPKCFHRMEPTSHSIGGHSAADCEYVLSPQTALGYSGGLVAVGEEPVALLNRRMQGGEPIARAIALAELRPWIAHAIDDPSPARQTDADYDDLAELIGSRALQILANPGTAELRRLGGFPRATAAYASKAPDERFKSLVVDLHRATSRCLDAWRTRREPIPPDFKSDCLALLGELLKCAVDRTGRTPAELAELAAADPERMFVACKRRGTAATVYCTLTDIPLRLSRRELADADADVGGGSVIDLSHLAQGVGADAERDAYKAVWVALNGTEMPASSASEDYVDLLQDALDMELNDFHADPYVLAIRGPREWLHGKGLASASERLRIGLVIYSGDCDCAFLAVSEMRLINLVRKYLTLLESAA